MLVQKGAVYVCACCMPLHAGKTRMLLSIMQAPAQAGAAPQQPQLEPAPSTHSSGSAGGVASASALPSGSVEKLLALELEVGAGRNHLSGWKQD